MLKNFHSILRNPFENCSDWSLFMVTVLVASLSCFSGLLISGLLGDDAYNSLILGKANQEGISFIDIYWNEVSGWLFGAGRFAPVMWFFNYAPYYFDFPVYFYKIINLIFISLGFFVFCRVLITAGIRINYSIFIMVTLPYCLFFRWNFDPIIAFNLLMPISFLLTSTSIFFFAKFWFESRSSKNLIFCFLFFFFSMLQYEVVFPFSGFFLGYSLIQLVKAKTKENICAVLVFFSFFLFVVAYYWISRAIPESNAYPAATADLSNLKAVALAFWAQLSAVIPIRSFAPVGIELWHILVFFVHTVIAWRILLILLRRQFQTFGFSAAGDGASFVVTLALALLVLPSLVVAVSGHQKWLAVSGGSYLPSYYQGFGLALVLGWFLGKLSDWGVANNRWALFLLVPLICVSSVVVVSNLLIVKHANESIGKIDREIMHEALDALDFDLPSTFIYVANYRFPHRYVWNVHRVTDDRVIYPCYLDQLETCIGKYYSDDFLQSTNEPLIPLIHPALILTEVDNGLRFDLVNSIKADLIGGTDAFVLGSNPAQCFDRTGSVACDSRFESKYILLDNLKLFDENECFYQVLPGVVDVWMPKEVSIDVKCVTPRTVKLDMTLLNPHDKEIIVRFGAVGARTLPAGAKSDVSVTVESGAPLAISSDAGDVPNSDPREIVFGIDSLQITLLGGSGSVYETYQD